MILRERVLNGIRDGTLTLAFRRWRRPSVKAGGTLLTSIGQLQIGGIRLIDLEEISAADLNRAGYASCVDLLAELNAGLEGEIYRIELGPLSADPRVALRETPATADDLVSLKEQLRRLDARATAPWTIKVLGLIEAHPALRAADLCQRAGQERMAFKINVRKLKALGLTESLEVGYRLSPRGSALLLELRAPLDLPDPLDLLDPEEPIMPIPQCPKCHASMEAGFIKDEGHGTVHASKWVEGPPEKSFWTGTKTRGKKQVQVQTYRCSSCGYLESYAS